MKEEYNPYKIVHHPEVIAKLKNKEQIYPMQVHLVVSNKCNQNCKFCLTESTTINTINGIKSIKDIKVGDFVYDHTGQISEVTETSRRTTDSIIELYFGNRKIEITEEHPILSKYGWKTASSFKIGDSAFMQMWMWKSSNISQRILELICKKSSTNRRNVTRSQRKNIKHDEGTKPNEKSSIIGKECTNSFKSWSLSEIRARFTKYFNCSKKKDELRPKSNEESRNLSKNYRKNTLTSKTKNRNSFRELVIRKLHRKYRSYIKCKNMDIEKKSRLSDKVSKKSNRINNERSIHWGKNKSFYRTICNSCYNALYKTWMELFSYLYERSHVYNTKRIEKYINRLSMRGIKLERNLVLRPLTKIRRIKKTVDVYNFSCKPNESYIANNIVVHNCAYRMEGYSSNEQFCDTDVMPYEKVIETLECLAYNGTKAIQFTGGGEPLFHPRIKDILLKTKELGLDVALVTNGVLLTEELIEIIKDIKWIRISVDAGTAETYTSLRQVKQIQYDRLIDNIQKLAKVKSKDTILGIGFVVCKENHWEIFKSAKMFKEMGVDNFRISAAFTPDGMTYFLDFIESAKSDAKQTKIELEDENFTVFNLFDDRISDLFVGSQNYDYCPMKELVVYIGADSKVYTCCILAYNQNGLVGDISNQSFSDLWDSNAKKHFYETHNPKCLCQLPCMFEKKNEFINYCIKQNPKHINYI